MEKNEVISALGQVIAALNTIEVKGESNCGNIYASIGIIRNVINNLSAINDSENAS